MTRIAILSNCQWNIAHFRAPLVAEWRARGWEVIAIAPFDGAEARLSAHGVETVDIALSRGGLSPMDDARLALGYRRALRNTGVDLVTAFTIKPNIYGSLAARTLGLPIVNNVSGLGTSFLSKLWLQRLVSGLYRAALSKSATVFFQNADDRDEFVANGLVRASQASVVDGSGVDLTHFSSQPMPNNAVPQFLFVGRLLRDKGLVELAAAAKLLRERGIEANIVVAGPLDLDNRSAITRETVQGWHRDGLVEWLGPLDDVRPAIMNADAIVLPSYREGLPRCLIEGAAMGRPSLASDVPGCRQAVENGVSGWLFPPRDPAGLADAMTTFVQMDRTTREAMGRAARERAERLFGESAVVAAYDEAIAQALKSRDMER